MHAEGCTEQTPGSDKTSDPRAWAAAALHDLPNSVASRQAQRHGGTGTLRSDRGLPT